MAPGLSVSEIVMMNVIFSSRPGVGERERERDSELDSEGDLESREKGSVTGPLEPVHPRTNPPQSNRTPRRVGPRATTKDSSPARI